MMIGHFFINRSKFAFVISIVIVIAGLISLFFLPVSMYPKVTPPTIIVTTSYPGANADTVLKSVVTPLEDAINGVQNMLYMESCSFNDGSVAIIVTFDVGTNGELASVNVQNRVYGAYASLPAEVQRQGVTVKEQSTDILCVIALSSPKNTYNSIFLNNYATINLKSELMRIPGIGSVSVFGNKDYSMRVWLDSSKLDSLGITPTDVINAIKEQNVQVASGQIGSEPSNPDQQFLYTIQTKGRLSDVSEFENIIVKASGGSMVRLKDVAYVELGAYSYASTGTLNGSQDAALIIINQRPGANALEVVDRINALIAQSGKSFPADVEAHMYYDTTQYVRASIHEVVKTLVIAIILVILVVYLFLQNWRSTIIPAITIPVALIGTLGVLFAIGYSINTITLFGLILAIGIVVDDSILEIENDNRLMEKEGLSPKEAAYKTVSQVTAPVIATTLVLMAVFVPVAFFPGMTGELYRQFSITIVTAVLISTLNALTLSPALCSSILKPPKEVKRNFIFRSFNASFDWFAAKYGKLVAFLVRKLVFVGVLFLIIFGVMCLVYEKTPTGFLPLEDQGKFMINVQLPSGASLNRTKEVTHELAAILKNTRGVKYFLTMDGYNGLTSSYSSSDAFIIVILDPWEERKGFELFQFSIIQRLTKEFAKVKDAQIMPFVPPQIPGLGMSDGFEFILQNTGNASPIEMGALADRLIEEAIDQPEIRYAFTTYRTDLPQLFVDVDRDKVKSMGANLSDVFAALQDYLGSIYVNDFNKFGKIYKVIVQGQTDMRGSIEDIGKIKIKGEGGSMIPLSTFIKVDKIAGPNYIAQFNMLPSVTIRGMSALGYSSGQAIKAMERVADKVMPSSYKYRWSGMSYQEILAGNKVLLIFIASFLFIYLFLVAQYESWVLVLAVMMAIPVAVLGAMASLLLVSKLLPLINNNLFAQVGIVLLFGLSTKTAILIVEFAKENHEKEGMSIIEAAKHASSLRLRAVLMTAISFVLGTFPLVIATGAGAMSMRSIGIVIFGGIIVSILIGTILIPGFYVIMTKLSECGKKK